MVRTRQSKYILALAQSSQDANIGKAVNVLASQSSSKSNQKNVKKRAPNKKRGGRKKGTVPKQKNKPTTAEKNTSEPKGAGRRGRKKGELSVNDENATKRKNARPKSRYEPNVNLRWNTRSRSRNAAETVLNLDSNKSNEPVEENLLNDKENEKKDRHSRQCIIIIDRLTPQEIEKFSKVRESQNDEDLTIQATESQRELSVARDESVNDELEAQAIQDTTKNTTERIENDDTNKHESHRRRPPPRRETDDENLDYIQMAMTSEEEEEDDEMPGFTSNNDSQHDSAQSVDLGYQTGKSSGLSHVQEWLNTPYISTDSINDANDDSFDPVLPEHEIILNVCQLSQIRSKVTALMTESIFDKAKDSVNEFDRESQISTHFSVTPSNSVDNMSVASTHFSEELEPERGPITEVAAPADARLNSISVQVANVNKSISNATTHFSEGEQELERNSSPLNLQCEMNDFTVANSSLYRTISVENVSNVSSPKRSRDEEESETMDIADKPNKSQERRRPQSQIQFSRPILQPDPKRRRNGSVMHVPRGSSETNRPIVSQPTRDRPEFHPNDFEHSSQPMAMVRKRFRPTSQNNSDNADSLSIDTPSDTDYQESNHQRFITQPTQLSHMNWGFSRNSSLETVLATNTSNVSAIPKYRYNRQQEDQTCFPMVPHTRYTSLVINGQTIFAVNDFDHGNANIKHHFLSRFNDSLVGLNENFCGIVYTTHITANLISHYLKVDRSRIIELEVNKTIVVENIKVTALELNSWPGATLFAFDTGSNGVTLHLGDLRIPADTEGIEYFVLNSIKKFYFDRSCLMKVYYHAPPDIDRYVGLIHECTKYHQENMNVGMLGMIVIGAFMHGMEPLILRLAEMFHMKVFMNLERREFLDRMLDNKIQANDSVHYRLRERVVDNPRKAHIHILDVENINESDLFNYLSNDTNASFNRILAIRPRGNGSHQIQLASNRFIKIIDIPNPLVGDYYEYRRFIESVRENPKLELELRQRQRQLQ